jgi:hypothetical protein
VTNHVGSNGGGEIHIVHYRRKDGTEATGRLEPSDRGGLSWFAPEDCEAITGIESIGGGGEYAPEPYFQPERTIGESYPYQFDQPQAVIISVGDPPGATGSGGSTSTVRHDPWRDGSAVGFGGPCTVVRHNHAPAEQCPDDCPTLYHNPTGGPSWMERHSHMPSEPCGMMCSGNPAKPR